MKQNKTMFSACVAAAVLTAWSCSRPAGPNVKRMPADKEFSGFLSGYDNLKPNPRFENTVSWVSADPVKNVHKYVAIIVDPPELFLASDSRADLVPDDGRKAAVEYFTQAIQRAVGDAFPIVSSPGPLVMRLRTALVGVDVGPEAAPDQKDGSLTRPISIGKVAVEMELVDSETGEQLAAAVDRQSLGEGEDAVIGSATFTREEKYRAATEAFDDWANRLRAFLDSAHELTPEDVARAEENNFPYASQVASKR